MRVLACELGGSGCNLRYWCRSIHGSLLKVQSGLKNSLLIRSTYTSGQVTCNCSTTLQDHLRHVLQHTHGRTTHAYKGAYHLATFEIRATLLLRVNTTVCECSWDPMTIWIARCCLWILKMFKSQRRLDATIFSHNTNTMHRATDASCNRTCGLLNLRSQTVLKRSGANCGKGYRIVCQMAQVNRSPFIVVQPRVKGCRRYKLSAF